MGPSPPAPHFPSRLVIGLKSTDLGVQPILGQALRYDCHAKLWQGGADALLGVLFTLKYVTSFSV